MFFLIFFTNSIPGQEKIYFITYGNESSPKEGDDNFVQEIYFEINDLKSSTVYVRIFDADCGGSYDAKYGSWNTETEFSFYSLNQPKDFIADGNSKPDESDLVDGQLLFSRIFGFDNDIDGTWITLGKIELNSNGRGSRHYKMSVKGKDGNDPNVFDVILTGKENSQEQQEGIRKFSFLPTLRMNSPGEYAAIKFKIPVNSESLNIHTFDIDNAVSFFQTRFNKSVPISLSGNGEWTSNKIILDKYESGFEAAINIGQWGATPNDFTFYLTNNQGDIIPVNFPVEFKKEFAQPVIKYNFSNLEECFKFNFEATGSYDEDGNELDFLWSLSDGANYSGSSITHRFENPGSYQITLIATNNRPYITNSNIVRFPITINQSPIAEFVYDSIAAPGQRVRFNAAHSKDEDGFISDYEWNMGGGVVIKGKSVSNIFTQPGKYPVKLTVYDNSSGICRSDSIVKDVFINFAPVADAGENRIGSNGEVLIFSAENSYDYDGKIIDYEWQFGDESSSNESVTRHSYSQPGNYKVLLKVKDNSNLRNSVSSALINVKINHPPVAKINKIKTSAVGEKITFDASGSYDIDGNISKFQWDMGDGNRSNDEKFIYRYDKAGKYKVKLTVFDDSGTDSDSDSTSVFIRINAPPVARAGEDVYASKSEIGFDASSSYDPDDSIKEFLWDFGDGTSGNKSIISHYYSEPGDYKVILTVKDNSNLSNSIDQDTMLVRINSKPVADAGPDLMVVPGQKFLISGKNSFDPDGSISEYVWTFENNKVTTGIELQHSFDTPGDKLFKLRVRDNSGHDSAVDFDEIKVRVNAPPVADAGGNKVSIPGEEIIFDASNSFDPDNDDLRYTWKFNDLSDVLEGERVSRTFEKGGIYSAILTIDDMNNLSNSRSNDEYYYLCQ